MYGAETARKTRPKSAMPGMTGQRRTNHQTLDGQYQMVVLRGAKASGTSAAEFTYPYLILGSINV